MTRVEFRKQFSKPTPLVTARIVGQDEGERGEMSPRSTIRGSVPNTRRGASSLHAGLGRWPVWMISLLIPLFAVEAGAASSPPLITTLVEGVRVEAPRPVEARPAAPAPAGKKPLSTGQPTGGPLAPETNTAPTPLTARSARPWKSEEMMRRISELGHASYTVRRLAMQRLAEGGLEVIPELIRAANGPRLESASRAVEVLRLMMHDPSAEARVAESAEKALDQLSLSRNPSIAARAERAMAANVELRERRAISEIERLGGVIDYGDSRFTDPMNPEAVRRRPHAVVLGIRWKGGDDGLRHLKRLSTLSTVMISKGTNVAPLSDKALKSLEDEFPNLKIEYRGLACLGVAGSSLNAGGAVGRGCYIQRVKPGSAAHNAGIRENDILTHFAGKEVIEFEALIKLIAENKPGDKIPVRVMRNGATVSLDVVLGEWAP